MSERLDSLLSPGSSVNGDSKSKADPYLESKCPLLNALLCLSVHNGKRRKRTTLLLFSDDGGAKVCLNDKDNGRVAFLTLETTEDMLEFVESKLEAMDVDWRPKRDSGKF